MSRLKKTVAHLRVTSTRPCIEKLITADCVPLETVQSLSGTIFYTENSLRLIRIYKFKSFTLYSI